MSIPNHIAKLIAAHPEWLPFQFDHSWKALADDLNYTYCLSCVDKIFVGDMCVVSYGKFTSTAVCYNCYLNNQDIIKKWME